MSPVDDRSQQCAPKDWTVRQETRGDLAGIRAAHLACFPFDAEARLVERLRDTGHLRVSLVALVDGLVVGHVALSPVRAAIGPPGAGLAPLAVLPVHRRRGIGAELAASGLELCAWLGLGWAVVLGDPGFYARFGFEAAERFGLADEYGGGPAFQALELSLGSLPRGAGLVRYAPEFSTLE